MTMKMVVGAPAMVLVASLLVSCATSPEPAAPSAATAATAPQPANGAAEAEKHTAETLEKKFQEAARGYKVVQRDGKTLYCKRERVIGSSIPTMQCLTEAQLRTQVETMEELRERMRHSGKCTLGPGCKGG